MPAAIVFKKRNAPGLSQPRGPERGCLLGSTIREHRSSATSPSSSPPLPLPLLNATSCSVRSLGARVVCVLWKRACSHHRLPCGPVTEAHAAQQDASSTFSSFLWRRHAGWDPKLLARTRERYRGSYTRTISDHFPGASLCSLGKPHVHLPDWASDWSGTPGSPKFPSEDIGRSSLIGFGSPSTPLPPPSFFFFCELIALVTLGETAQMGVRSCRRKKWASPDRLVYLVSSTNKKFPSFSLVYSSTNTIPNILAPDAWASRTFSPLRIRVHDDIRYVRTTCVVIHRTNFQGARLRLVMKYSSRSEPVCGRDPACGTPIDLELEASPARECAVRMTAHSIRSPAVRRFSSDVVPTSNKEGIIQRSCR